MKFNNKLLVKPLIFGQRDSHPPHVTHTCIITPHKVIYKFFNLVSNRGNSATMF